VLLPVPYVDYYFRVYATNSAGESWAAESLSFFATDLISWKQTAAGAHEWTNSVNWSPEVVPNSQFAIAAITNDRSGSQTINVGQTITVGQLILGATNAITVAKMTGGAFRFDNGIWNSRLVVTNTPFSSDVPVTYGSGSGWEISNDTAITLTGNFGGFSNLIKKGTAILTLSGSHSYSGDLIIKSGNIYASEYHVNLVPDASWVQLEGGAYFRLVKSSETIKGVRGTGSVFINGQPCFFIIGTNATGATTYDVTLVAGGELRPGFDATVGDLYLQRSAAANCNAHILGGDIYLDVTGPTTFDRIMFQYGANLISGGNLHLNFLSGYTPTNGSSWDVMVRITSGSIADATPGDPLFASIDSNIAGARFTAAIVGGTIVRVKRADIRGAMIMVR
jgi:autotransporter-associated beta strand protein